MSDLKNALQKRLEENYAAYAAQLTKKSFADLIDAAEEIAAAKYVCEHLAEVCTDKNAALFPGCVPGASGWGRANVSCLAIKRYVTTSKATPRPLLSVFCGRTTTPCR